MLCLATFLIAGYAFLEGWLVSGDRAMTRIVIFAVALINLISYLLLRQGWLVKFITFFTILSLYAVSILFWFWIGGINGPSGVLILVSITLSFVFISKKYRTHIFLLNIVLISALTFVHIYFPTSIHYNYVPFNGFAIDYLLVAIGLIIVIFLLKREVDIERKRIHYKNKQLLQLNHDLKSTVKSQLTTFKALSDTRDKLVESEKMASIGKLTAGLAHELNNPLNFVGGMVTPLRQDIEELIQMIPENKQGEAEELSDEIQSLLHSIEHGTQLATSIIKRLLMIRPKGVGDSNFPIKLNELVENVVELAKKSSGEIRISYELDPACIVLGNQVELSQVILNLIRNSMQAIPEGRTGEILVKISCDEANAHITVKDNGMGMDEETISHAFEAFYTTKSSDKGTGLGLFITYGIIQNHGGSIALSSEPGEGTTILISLPLIQTGS